MKYTAPLLLLLGAAAWADDPAKQPPMPPAKQPTDKAKQPDAPKPAAAAGQDEAAKIYERLMKNSKSAEERLGKTDPGEETRKLQRDVLRDIDELLKQQQQQQSSQSQSQSQSQSSQSQSQSGGGGGGQSQSQSKSSSSSGGGGSAGAQRQPSGGGQSGSTPSAGSSGGQAGGKPQPGGAQARQQRREQRERQRQARGGQSKPGDKPGDQTATAKAGGSDDKPNPQNEGPGGMGTEGGTGGKPDDRPPKPADAKLAELYKNPWGHLPEKTRQEMDAYFKEKFMPRYSDLLRQYYSTIAEQNKKGGPP